MRTECLEHRSVIQIFSWACQNMVDGICPAKPGACPFPEDKPCAKVTSSDWDEVLKEPKEAKDEN